MPDVNSGNKKEEGRGKGSKVQILALVIGILPVYAFAFLTHITNSEPTPLSTLMLYICLGGTSAGILIILVLNFLCGERVGAMNTKPGVWWIDIITGIGLSVILFLFMGLFQATLGQVLHREQPAEEVLTIMKGLADNPLMFALWLGPIIWIPVAGFEELSRVFMMTRIWKAWPGNIGLWSAIFISSFLFGMVHIYQGASGVVSIMLMSVLKGILYLYQGRIMPLIIAHAIFDSVQIIVFVSMVKNGVI